MSTPVEEKLADFLTVLRYSNGWTRDQVVAIVDQVWLPSFEPGLNDALDAARTGRGGDGRRPCTLCVVLEHAVPGPGRDALNEAAAGRLSGRALRDALRQVGINIDRTVISNHRNEAHRL